MRDQKGCQMKLSAALIGNLEYLWSSANFRRLRLEIEFMQNGSAGYSTCEDEKEVCGVKVLVSMSSPIRVGWL
jgi:hypothetical protein